MVDILGYRRKLGLIVPAHNTVVAADVQQLYVTGVTIHASDFNDNATAAADPRNADRTRPAVDSAVEAAARMAMRRPDSVGLLSDDVFFDPTGGAELLRAVADLFPSVLNPVDALRSASRTTGIGGGGVGLLTPYRSGDAQTARDVLASIGIRVVTSEVLGVDTPSQAAESTFLRLREQVGRLATKRVDAIVQLGHNVPLGRLVNNIEEDLGVPVLAINHVCVWHMLRQAGIDDVVPGLGKLFVDY